MSTLEALNAISEAIQAHAKLPEVERTLKQMEELAEFRQLELDEANQTINSLRETIASLSNQVTELKSQIGDRDATIYDLTIRNDNLDRSHYDLSQSHSNVLHTLNERELEIESLRLTKTSLEERLTESKSVTERLTTVLKSIGQSIVSAVAEPEPEVSNPSTFRDSVAMPDPASVELDGSNNPEPMPTLVESPRPTVVDESGVSAGCAIYRYR